MQLSAQKHLSWLKDISSDQQHLITLSWLLYEREQTKPLTDFPEAIDYTFVIFPMAKAFEGFLKEYLWKEQLITESTYRSRRFRLGRALNPDVFPDQRDRDWLFDDLSRQCGEAVARQVWQAWLDCRNHAFHWYPDSSQQMTLAQAHHCLEELGEAIEALLSCRITTFTNPPERPHDH
jgi:hypothetical protein